MTTRRDFVAGVAAMAAISRWREVPEFVLVGGAVLIQDPTTPRPRNLGWKTR